MGHTNSTTNYALPQFLTTDKPAWLTDINNAFLAIDTGMDAAKDAADNAQSDATQALTNAGNAATAAATADAKGSGAVASIEAAFDDTAVYAIGAKVMYNSLLYRCTVAVTTPGPWTGSANWERITVDSIIPTNATNLPYTSGGSAGSTGYEIDELKGYLLTDIANGTIPNIGANNYADPVYTLPSHVGYSAIGIIGMYIGSLSCVSGGYYLQDAGTKVKIIVRNVTNTALTNVDVTGVILYKKDFA